MAPLDGHKTTSYGIAAGEENDLTATFGHRPHHLLQPHLVVRGRQMLRRGLAQLQRTSLRSAGSLMMLAAVTLPLFGMTPATQTVAQAQPELLAIATRHPSLQVGVIVQKSGQDA